METREDVSPDLFWDTATAYQRTAAIKAAVELEIFTHIGQAAATAAEIAERSGAAERGVRILCDALTVMGFLAKSGARYSLTPSSAAFLDKSSPTYVGSISDFITDVSLRRGFDDLTNAVRRGGTTVTGDGSVDPESPMWAKFARAMSPMAMPSAAAIAGHFAARNKGPVKILDIAAGHGIFGAMVAKDNPEAEVFAVDWKNVLPVARENAERFGIADRFNEIPGSAFEVNLGEGYDMVLITNFLHHFDPAACEAFLKRVRRAIAEKGVVYTLEFIPGPDRVSPPREAMFSLVMLAGTPGGDAYTFDELRRMLENAGFSRNQHIPLEPMPQHLVISKA